MSASTSWDRAAALPVPTGDHPRPEITTLADGMPSIDALFTFMRDAELRFATLRMRIEEHAWNARGEEVSLIEITVRHPGNARILTSIPALGLTGSYDVWISDGATVRTFTASRKVGTRRPVRHGVRGLGDPDLPGTARVYVPVTSLQAESLADMFVHPAGYCQNVLATGACRITGTTLVTGREAIVVECDHPRTIEAAADRPDFRVRVAVDRRDGVILRLEESMGDQPTRDAVVTSYEPDAVLPPGAFAFNFPSDTVFIY